MFFLILDQISLMSLPHLKKKKKKKEFPTHIPRKVLGLLGFHSLSHHWLSRVVSLFFYAVVSRNIAELLALAGVDMLCCARLLPDWWVERGLFHLLQFQMLPFPFLCKCRVTTGIHCLR